MASYERLADAAFSAAVDLKRREKNNTAATPNFEEFVRLISEPVTTASAFNLLYDSRKLPLYRAAWSEVFGAQDKNLQKDILRTRIADLLKETLHQLASGSLTDVKPVANFCLALNRIFLNENNRAQFDALAMRHYHAEA